MEDLDPKNDRELLVEVLHRCLNYSQAIHFQLEIMADRSSVKLPAGFDSVRAAASTMVEWLHDTAESIVDIDEEIRGHLAERVEQRSPEAES